MGHGIQGHDRDGRGLSQPGDCRSPDPDDLPPVNVVFDVVLQGFSPEISYSAFERPWGGRNKEAKSRFPIGFHAR